MEKISRQRAPKGTVTIRTKGNSFEARVTLDLTAIVKGVDKNPRLSRTAKTEKEARERLGEEIANIYFKIQKQMHTEKVFSDECAEELDHFEEFKEQKSKRKIIELADDYTLFPNIAKEWINWKKKQINPSSNKTISPKTVEAYINSIQSYIVPDFKYYHVADITKELVEDYINEKRKETPRMAKDLYLLIKCILVYAKDERKLIDKIPQFGLKFPKKKRATKAKIPYLPEERQSVWLDYFENDGREFALLYATLLQTGMRPEEGCGLKWKCVAFETNLITVENAYKDIILYDDDMKVIGHECRDDTLKIEESYRTIPMTPRLKAMLIKLKEQKMQEYKEQGKKWDNSEYVFLNTNGKPFVPERLTNKMPKFIKKYGLEHMTVYGLRHSFATLNSEKGMDKEVLRELMGHSEFETTDFYYVHISEERKKKEFEKIHQDTFQGKNEQNKGKKYFVKKKIKTLKLA